MTLTLQFDGSLRGTNFRAPPPSKYTPPAAVSSPLASSSDAAFPKPSLAFLATPAYPTAKVAACAACLYWGNGRDATMLALAGKLLKPLDTEEAMATQSVHAEYESLLLGLSVLNDFVGSDERGAAGPSPPKPLDALDAILIQGDCTSVLSQVYWRSPDNDRHEAYWSRAKSLLSSIEGRWESSNEPPLILADYVGRAKNSVCDDLASRIALRQQGTLAHELRTAITSHHLRQDPCAPPAETLSIADLLHRVPRVVPFSGRPTYYGMLADAAWSTAAYPELVRAGRQLELSIKTMISTSRRSHGPEAKAKFRVNDEQRALGVALQIVGYKKLNQPDEARQLRRRNRKLLGAHPKVVRAVERITDANTSLSDVLKRWIDLSTPPLDEDPTFNPPGIGDEINEWMRRAYASKEWDENGSYVLWFQ